MLPFKNWHIFIGDSNGFCKKISKISYFDHIHLPHLPLSYLSILKNKHIHNIPFCFILLLNIYLHMCTVHACHDPCVKFRGQHSWVAFLLVLLWGKCAGGVPGTSGCPAQEVRLSRPRASGDCCVSAFYVTTESWDYRCKPWDPALGVTGVKLRPSGLCHTRLSLSSHPRGPKAALSKFKIVILTLLARRSKCRGLNLYLKISISKLLQ